MSLILSPRGCRVLTAGVLGVPGLAGTPRCLLQSSPFPRCTGDALPADQLQLWIPHRFGAISPTPLARALPRLGAAPRVPSCIPPLHPTAASHRRIPLPRPHGSPSPNGPSGFAVRGQAPTRGWGVSALAPRPGSALPMPACASPHGSSHGPRPPRQRLPLARRQALTGLSHRGEPTAQKPAAPGALRSRRRLPVPHGQG